jgi:hypothetical protein
MKSLLVLWAVAAAAFVTVFERQTQAEEPLIQRPVTQPPRFGDAVIDKALARVAEKSELALVQEKPLKELAVKWVEQSREADGKASEGVQELQLAYDAAQKKAPEAAETKALADRVAAKRKEIARLQTVRRERLVGEIAAILYPDQAELLWKAYEEELLDPADVLPHQWAQARMGALLGRVEIEPAERKKIAAALTDSYRTICPAIAALEAEYKSRLSDPKAAEEYRVKREAFFKPVRARTIELARGLLGPDKQKEFDTEWNRRQERRIQVLQRKIRNEAAPQTAEGRTELEKLLEVFHAATRHLDLDSSDFDALAERLKGDAEALK